MKYIFLLSTFFFFFSCEKSQNPQVILTLNKSFTIEKKSNNNNIEEDNYSKKVITVDNIPVYTRAKMQSKKAKIKLKAGQEIFVESEYIKIKNKRSFDFAKWKYKNKFYYLPLQFLGEIPVEQVYLNENIKIGEEKVDKYQALPLSYIPNDLELVPKKYRATGYKSRKMKLRKEALKAFIKMCDAAKKDDIELKLLSCFRTAQYQQGPYKRAIRAAGPKQMSSAKPGHSEHQLGTVADVTCSDVQYRLTQDFAGTKTHKWIKENASRFGIYISYDKKNYFRKGYIWEPWHLRYWADKKPTIN